MCLSDQCIMVSHVLIDATMKQLPAFHFVLTIIKSVTHLATNQGLAKVTRKYTYQGCA